ncbi:MAG: outer membrane protein transport protein [Burkholderiales bacterium]|nr:outer membrane protein transport protein [Burkholderiales bacterium]MDE2452561.1 outer membrane protein transport protein [Burkholderiales bacterium]
MEAIRKASRLAPLGALFAAGAAFATNGYFPDGYGMKASGMGGAAVAMTEDAMGGANNPASLVWVGSRLDLGLSLFSPERSASRSGAGFPTLDGSVTSGNTSFLIPEFGYNRMLGANASVGLTVYGNGGMNTSYPQGSFNCGQGAANMLCGSGSLGVDLSQLVIAPSAAFKLNDRHSLGISLLLGFQHFKAYGLQMFTGLSGAAGSVTNNGYADSHGVGLRLGYLGRLNDWVSIGAAWAPKMSMSRFDKYQGLFADGGKFDIPQHYSLGIAITPMPALTLALDYERIDYAGIASVGNPSTNQTALGSAGGPGFGWKNIDVFKLGVQWHVSDAWTLRAGYNHGSNPVTAQNVTFNIIAPGVVTTHYTAGFSWNLDPANEISAALMIAPRQSVAGSSLFNVLQGPGVGGNETIGMRQREFGIAWGHRF